MSGDVGAEFWVRMVLDDLATVGRTRPEVAELLDGIGVTRNLQRALEALEGES